MIQQIADWPTEGFAYLVCETKVWTEHATYTKVWWKTRQKPQTCMCASILCVDMYKQYYKHVVSLLELEFVEQRRQ